MIYTKVLAAALECGKSWHAMIKIDEAGEKVRGLEKDDPKYARWEGRLFRAERRYDKAKKNLLRLAKEYAEEQR